MRHRPIAVKSPQIVTLASPLSAPGEISSGKLSIKSSTPRAAQKPQQCMANGVAFLTGYVSAPCNESIGTPASPQNVTGLRSEKARRGQLEQSGTLIGVNVYASDEPLRGRQNIMVGPIDGFGSLEIVVWALRVLSGRSPIAP